MQSFGNLDIHCVNYKNSKAFCYWYKLAIFYFTNKETSKGWVCDNFPRQKMATGLDRLLFTLTTTLIVARILAFPTQIDLPDNEYMVEDLGLYSGTKPKPSCYDFSLDLSQYGIASQNQLYRQNQLKILKSA